MVAPVFLFCLAAAQASDRGAVPLHALWDALPGIVIAIVVGAVVYAAVVPVMIYRLWEFFADLVRFSLWPLAA